MSQYETTEAPGLDIEGALAIVPKRCQRKAATRPATKRRGTILVNESKYKLTGPEQLNSLPVIYRVDQVYGTTHSQNMIQKYRNDNMSY